jgi:hypothetical protein
LVPDLRNRIEFRAFCDFLRTICFRDSFAELRGENDGGVTTGGAYAFDVDNSQAAVNRALGVQPTGDDSTPGYYQLEVVNNTGSTMSNWFVSFTSYYYNDQDRANSLTFAYSTVGSVFTEIAGGRFTSPANKDASPSWDVGAAWSGTISAPVADGGSLYLRWTGDDESGGGYRDEFALDDVVVVPEPSSILPFFATGFLGLLQRRRAAGKVWGEAPR